MFQIYQISFFFFKTDKIISADFNFRIPAGSTKEQHAPSKLFSPRHSKELKIPARPRVEVVDDREGGG